ncbi:hypothetical protein GS493_05805 [Rhodococcus hoagii]|nr:hypothetical protein [Prescottella equi]
MQTLWPHARIGKNDNKSDALAPRDDGRAEVVWYEPELPQPLRAARELACGVGA